MKAIEEISSLRFIFILLIVLHHTVSYTGGGYLGVAFFFMLGGFVMTLGYRDRILGGDFSYRAFLLRRAKKYYLLHWICLAAVLVLLVYTHAIGKDRVGTLLVNAALLQSWVPVKSVYFSFNAPSWFLSDMLFFVALFPLLLKGITAILRSKRGAAALLIALVAGYLALFFTLKEESRHYVLYIFPLVRLMDFVLGIFTAHLFLSIRKKETALPVPALKVLMYGSLALLILLSLVLPTRYLMCSLLFAPLIATLLILTSLESVGKRSLFAWKPLVYLGSFSFEIYMLHGVVLRYLEYYGIL